ncbi:MAG: RHS repeat-associated core domain-containing protein [Deltaproteobacteria bacterium]|nr:RHS repeat-associated core domain-containing protein [Deltaproteobacteria bacterium]
MPDRPTRSNWLVLSILAVLAAVLGLALAAGTSNERVVSVTGTAGPLGAPEGLFKPPCPPCHDRDWICDSDLPPDPKDPDGPIKTTLPDGPRERPKCHWGECFPKEGGSDIECMNPPPSEIEDSMCAETRPPLVHLPGCDPRVCRPDPDLWQVNPGDRNSGLPSVPEKCKYATTLDEECTNDQTLDVLELFAIFNPGGSALATCQQNGGGVRCQPDGSYCQITSSGSNCLKCDESGSCFRYRTTEGVGVCLDSNWRPVSGCSEGIPLPKSSTAEEEDADEKERIAAAKEATEQAHRQAEEARRIANEDARRRDGHGTSPEPTPTTLGVPGAQASGPPRGQNERIVCLRKQNCPEARKPDGKLQPPLFLKRNEDTKEGDPVAVGSGQLVDGAVDLAIPAAPGSSLHFKLQRFYNSGGISQGALGRNWWHSYEERIVPVTEYYPDVTRLPKHCVEALPTVRCVAHETGPVSRIYYQDAKTLVFIPEPGNYSTVIHDADGGRFTWALREQDGTITMFDRDGRLRLRRDRNGYMLNFYYGADDGGPLQAVVDPLQRVVRFAYDTLGRLETVTDFTGRTVKYTYETLDTPSSIPSTLSKALGIKEELRGLYDTQSLLTSVTHSAPEIPGVAAARSATWQYRYLSIEDVYRSVWLPEVHPPTKETCSQVGDDFQAFIEYMLLRDHLIGNLTEVIDPAGKIVLRSKYETNPSSDQFDRVVAQQYGENAERDQRGVWARFDYFTEHNVPAEVKDGVTLEARSCEQIWRANVARPYVPVEYDRVFVPRVGGNRGGDGRFGFLGGGGFGSSGTWVTVPRPLPIYAVKVAELTKDRSAVCQWTQFADQLQQATWYGLNFMGEPVVIARGASPGESPRWIRTHLRYNFHGEVVQRKADSGHVFEWTYDAESLNPLSRGNVLSQKETSGTTSRAWSFAYEPLGNQLLWVKDALGRETSFIYDYMEEASATGADRVVATLASWGSRASSISQLSPKLTFLGSDVNRDGRTDRDAGNLIRVTRPTATLASGARQEHVTIYRYNEFGQVTAVEEPGNPITGYAYYPANRPDGGELESVLMSSSYTRFLTQEQRDGRWRAGGHLSWTSQVLGQGTASEFGKAGATELRQAFAYDNRGNVTSVTGPDGSVVAMQHDGFGQVVRTVDAEGYEQRFAYDENQNLAWSEETIDRASRGRLRRTRRIQDRAGSVVASCAELEAGTCEGDLPTLIARRDQGAKLVLTTYEHDAEGNLVATVDPEGHRHEAKYNTRGLPRTVTRGIGAAAPESMSLEYDVEGRPVRVANGAGETTTLVYDGYGRLDREVWPNGTTVDYDHDDGDRVTSERVIDKYNTDLAFVRYVADERDRLREIGRRWTVPSGQLPQEGYRNELLTKLELGDHDQPTAITDPAGARYTFEYDTLGRQVRAVDPLGNQALSYEDVLGRKLFSRVRGEGRHVTSEVTLDRRGLAVELLTRGADGLSTRASRMHDGLGNVVSATDAQGNTQVTTYDLLGQVATTATPQDEAGAATLVATHEYDRRGLPTKLTDPAGVVTTWRHDEAGRVTAEQAGNRSAGITYDGAGRVARVTRANGVTLTMGYQDGYLATIVEGIQGARQLRRDGLGRVSTASNRTGSRWTTSNLVYDSLGRVLSESTTIGHSALRTRYAYDAVGALRALEYPDGTKATMATDTLGRVTTVQLGTTRAELTWRGGAVATMGVQADDRSRIYLARNSYDGLERPVVSLVGRQPSCLGGGGATCTAPTNVFREQRVLDPLGRVRLQMVRWQHENGDVAPRIRAFQYSGSGWLQGMAEVAGETSVLGTATTNAEVERWIPARFDTATRTSFVRNTVGTLLGEQRAGATLFTGRTGTTDHRFTDVTVGGVSLPVTYDQDGHLRTDGRSRFTWDSFDRLIAAETVGTNKSVEYAYDAFDRRVARFSKVSGNVTLTETFALAGWETIATYRNRALHSKTLLGPTMDQPLQVEANGQPTYPYYDIQGNVAGVLVGKNARPAERYEYDAYGNAKVYGPAGQLACEETGLTVCTTWIDYGYNGQLRDAETGLYYYKNRYYSPKLRSFLTQDPLGYVDSFNPWAYVGGDPINYTDPLGLESAMKNGGIHPRGILAYPFDPKACKGRADCQWIISHGSAAERTKGKTRPPTATPAPTPKGSTGTSGRTRKLGGGARSGPQGASTGPAGTPGNPNGDPRGVVGGVSIGVPGGITEVPFFEGRFGLLKHLNPTVTPEVKFAIQGAQIVLAILGGIWSGIQEGLAGANAIGLVDDATPPIKPGTSGGLADEGARNTTPSPALEGSPYSPAEVADRVRPTYRANPQHNPRATQGAFRTPEPPDAAIVYQTAQRAGLGEWFGKGQNGWYRYFSDNAGGVHFSGIVPDDLVPIHLRRGR